MPWAIKTLDPGALTVRPMTPEDIPFVTDSWARSFLHSPSVRNVPDDVYKLEIRARIDRLLKQSVTLVLSAADSPTHVSGFVIFQPPKNDASLPILHYLLIHANLQDRGLGSKLFKLVSDTRNSPEDPCWATHWTIPMKRVISRWNLIFNPFLLEVS